MKKLFIDCSKIFKWLPPLPCCHINQVQEYFCPLNMPQKPYTQPFSFMGTFYETRYICYYKGFILFYPNNSKIGNNCGKGII